MHLLGKAILISVLMAIGSVTVLACDCVDLSETESFVDSDVVFIGEVISVDRSASITTFKVQRWFKGTKTNKVVVYDLGTNCNAWFHPESTYLVFAKEFEGRLIAPSCYASKAIGPPRFESLPTVRFGLPLRGRNYAEIALITGTCVALSLGVGFLVGAIRNRFR
jgi:hypothetical protein